MEASGDVVISPKSEDLGSNKFKFLCSYGGQILPRPGDGNLRYVGGETRLVAVSKNAIFQEIMNKLENMCGARVVLKYQLPLEDLDLLVSVTCEEDLQNMKEEYERYESFSCKETSTIRRIFLFPSRQIQADHSTENQTLEQKYIDAVNGILIHSKHKLPDYSEMDIDSSAPSTARTNSGSFQADHPHHLVQTLQEVDLSRRHPDQFTCKCISSPRDQSRVCTQSKPMIQVESSTFELQRVQSSPNLLQQFQGIPTPNCSPLKHVPARPAIVYRGRGGESPPGRRLRYSRSDAHINRPPYQFIHAEQTFCQDKEMKVAQASVLAAQESPRNVGNHNHMSRNTNLQDPQSPNHKHMTRNTSFQEPHSPNLKLMTRDPQCPHPKLMTRDPQCPNPKLMTRNTSFQDIQSPRMIQ